MADFVSAPTDSKAIRKAGFDLALNDALTLGNPPSNIHRIGGDTLDAIREVARQWPNATAASVQNAKKELADFEAWLAAH